ncbi:hypothetical protein [Photorhabdus heterorhabditis]|uniref:Uncharacterized protein n=1 Tax=Photorhabdus heterorhabditis TaxID=880156 RepID=A0A5B0W527_9GAMM|nr:hypothetical protein [Photorhabdus heterorhabditis]KAA1182086.1 hypothetical protein F0L16_16900 [Photorhabdus heterorhabditis]KOY62526.1 hypothetical protein AM629_08110 [Photorhabdus heterorhabditis]MBS9443770.1 hypothetical protein [Photorhabdus heterorhabditis]
MDKNNELHFYHFIKNNKNKRITFSDLINNVNDLGMILFFVLFCDLYHILLSNSVDYFEQSESRINNVIAN